MTERAPYVSVYPSDWLGGCATIPALAEWVYHQICLHNWDKGEPVPERRLPMLFMRHPGGKEGWQSDLDLLLDIGKLVRSQSGSIWSKRALVEAQKAQNALEKRKIGGKAGAEKRWQNNNKDRSPIADPCKNDGIPYGNQNQNQNQNQIIPNGITPPTPHDEAANGDLVFSVPIDAMQAFRAHRTKLKAPLTAHAEKLILRKLEQFQAAYGHDPTKVLEQSIERGWKGIFELKENSHGNRTRNAGNGLLDAALGELGQRGSA